MESTPPSLQPRDLDIGMEVDAVGSQAPFHEQLYASLKNEIKVITRFLMKLEVSKEEGKTSHDAATLKIVRDTMEKDVKEVSKTAQSIIHKFEQLDKVHASSKEDSPTHQSFRNMRTNYITQVEEVLNVVNSLAGVEIQSMDGEDSFTDCSRDIYSIISMRKRLEGLRMVDSLAGVEIQRVETAVGSQAPVYEQLYASLKNEMEIIMRFLMKLEVSKEEGKTIHNAATLKTVRDTMEKDLKEISKTAQSIIDKFEQLDKVHASSKSPTDQSFRNMRTNYITQVEEVLNVVNSLAGVETLSMDGEDSFTESWSDTYSMISMRKRLEGLRKVDSLERVETAEVLIIQLQGVAKKFSYAELQMATRGFSEKLGVGGFGNVYRGMLPPHIPVAVKRMKVDSTDGQGMKEFKGEVSIITQLRHRNLIELLGWCEDEARKEYMLVYELMPNGSLDNLLFKPSVKRGGVLGEEGTERRGTEGGAVKVTTCLSWSQRFNILTGIADALDYLHRGWKHQVIHGDIKCANILLDKKWNPKLADFGLSRLVDHEGEAYTIHFAGTRGYAAPELFTEGKFTDKSDVYAFGAVVLEVVCGRRNWPGDAHEMSLVECVRARLSKGDVISIVDKELRGCDMHQMETTLMIGLACCDFDHWKRPSMKLVVKMLAGERYDELKKMIKGKAEDAGPSREASDQNQKPENPSTGPRESPPNSAASEFQKPATYDSIEKEKNIVEHGVDARGPQIARHSEEFDTPAGYPADPSPLQTQDERGQAAKDIEAVWGLAREGEESRKFELGYSFPFNYSSTSDHETRVERGNFSTSDHETRLENDNRSESKKTWWKRFGTASLKLGRQAALNGITFGYYGMRMAKIAEFTKVEPQLFHVSGGCSP